MNFRIRFVILIQVFSFILFLIQEVTSDESRNIQNHRNDLHDLKDFAGHWIGIPKNPYASFLATTNPTTASTTPPTSAPIIPSRKPKQKRTKLKNLSNKRRYDDDDAPDYRDAYRNREKYTFEEDFDYDYGGFGPTTYRKSYSPAPYVITASASSPKAVYVNPAIGSSSAIKALYAGTPKVATYVIPNTKKYYVERVKSEAVYVPPSARSQDMYAAASSSNVRRVDPMDYDESGGNSFLNLGPQEGFPPKPVMNKISQPGQRQPCHGPDCHQHHKGLVRFYWRRVVYPPNEGPRGRARVRFRRRPGRGRGRRRRLRGSARAPSDQRDVYYQDDNEDDDNDEAEDEVKPYENSNDDEEEDEEEEDNEESDTKRRNVWQPGKAYGHNLNEGNNYDDQEKKVYRDKRFAYRKRLKNRFVNQ